jgi:hypothetical protein
MVSLRPLVLPHMMCNFAPMQSYQCWSVTELLILYYELSYMYEFIMIELACVISLLF